MAPIAHSLSIVAVIAIAGFAIASTWLQDIISPYFRDPSLQDPIYTPYECPADHTYTTQIVSLDPLLIYIESFLRPAEITALLSASEDAFAPSTVYKSGRTTGTSDRTSLSAALPREDPTVECVLSRAQRFMGTMLDPSRDDIGPPQLVRYTSGQRFNKHHDWYPSPQASRPGMRGHGRTWNRVASFFAILEDGCEEGETWFPRISPPGPEGEFWRAHEEGGVKFTPVAGNALFWVNLHANGTGDERTVHAGLPVKEGLKTAMNIWPRKFYD